jgi:hypothetical protein
MALSPAQIASLRAVVLAEPSLVGATDQQVADWCNANAQPGYFVWRSTTPTEDVLKAIIPQAMIPPTPDASRAWTNRAAAVAARWALIAPLLTRASVVSASGGVRSLFRVALNRVPSGRDGAAQDAGWDKVSNAMNRKATNAEKALASGGSGASNDPADLGWEGTVTPAEAAQLH